MSDILLDTGDALNASPKPKLPFGNGLGGRQCKGKSVMSGQRCKKLAMKGRDYCRKHGGCVPVGPAHGMFKHGRTSRYWLALPQKYRDGYEAAVADEQLLSLAENLVVHDRRFCEVLKTLDGAKQVPWSSAIEALRLVKAEKAPKKKSDLLAALGKLLEEGRSAEAITRSAWAELRELSLERAQIAAAEAKRLKDLEAVLPVEFTAELLTQILTSIRNRVKDLRLVKEITDDVRHLLPPARAQ